jgi:hypothetical protein
MFQYRHFFFKTFVETQGDIKCPFRIVEIMDNFLARCQRSWLSINPSQTPPFRRCNLNCCFRKLLFLFLQTPNTLDLIFISIQDATLYTVPPITFTLTIPSGIRMNSPFNSTLSTCFSSLPTLRRKAKKL